MGDLLVYKHILEKSKNKNPKNKIGEVPLSRAAFKGHYELCEFLIQREEEKNPKDNGGWTPLHDIAVEGHLELCKLFMKHVSDMNPKDHKGKVIFNRLAILKLLLVSFFRIQSTKNSYSIETDSINSGKGQDFDQVTQ